MPKKKLNLVELIMWMVGIVVTLAVGFGLIGGALAIPYSWFPSMITVVAGWIVVVMTIIGAVMKLAK